MNTKVQLLEQRKKLTRDYFEARDSGNYNQANKIQSQIDQLTERMQSDASSIGIEDIYGLIG